MLKIEMQLMSFLQGSSQRHAVFIQVSILTPLEKFEVWFLKTHRDVAHGRAIWFRMPISSNNKYYKMTSMRKIKLAVLTE